MNSSPLATFLISIDVPFVDSWLRATLLNQRAVDAYWNNDKSLRVEEIEVDSDITSRDISNRICIRGRSEARQDVESCPMLLLGGSILHFHEFAGSVSRLRSGSSTLTLQARSSLDLGQLQLAEMVFPTLLHRHETFDIEHEHEWPGAMTPGVDIMWYPYAAMFSREVDTLTIRVKFDSAAIFIRGYVANLQDGTCRLLRVQPTPVDPAGMEFKWTIDDVDNQEIYALVFER